jgi:hypothetical protein
MCRTITPCQSHHTYEEWLRFKGYQLVEDWARDSEGNYLNAGFYDKVNGSCMDKVKYSDEVSEGWSEYLDPATKHFKKGKRDEGVRKRLEHLRSLWFAANPDPRFIEGENRLLAAGNVSTATFAAGVPFVESSSLPNSSAKDTAGVKRPNDGKLYSPRSRL